MKIIIHDYVHGGDTVLVFPDPEPGNSKLVLGIRTEHQPPDDPTRSLAAREVYVGPKGGITVRTV